MNNNLRKLNLVSIITGIILIASCNKFEYSPYNAHVSENKTGLTNLNILKLKELQPGSNYSFAIISDIHVSYDELNLFIDHVNNNPDILFTIITGDITHHGLYNEFLTLQNSLDGLEKAVFTVIGNHDYFYNGDIIYRQMYGECNYSFILGKIRYIFFDSNIGARQNNVDLNWLKREIDDSIVAEKCILLSHIAPYSYMNESDNEIKNNYIEIQSAPNLLYSFFGHEHIWDQTDNLKLVHVDCIANRNYTKVEINDTTISIQKISF